VWRRFSYSRPGVEDRSFKANTNAREFVIYAREEIQHKIGIGFGVGQFREGPAGLACVNHLATINRSDPNYAPFMRECAESREKGVRFVRLYRMDDHRWWRRPACWSRWGEDAFR